MLPDWVFRIGWGLPIARSYLQLRMEAAQLGTTMRAASQMRKKLNEQTNTQKSKGQSTLQWAIKTSVPGDDSGKSWGDFYFAHEIAESLTRLGYKARVDMRDKVINEDSANDDVVLVIRGVERIRPQKGAINLLWIISHPSRISNHELKSFDGVFAASNKWAKKRTKSSRVSIAPLLQATNPEKFNPDHASPDSGEEILFIGNSRHQYRRIIKDCVAQDIRPSIYGRDWSEFIPVDLVKATFVPNDEIGMMYRSAGVVLNDHWSDMAEQGFISNRLFDAAAAGARVISDSVDELDEIFKGAVKTYSQPSELKVLCSANSHAKWGTDAEVTERAFEIGKLHSFDARVAVLIKKAQDLLGN